MAFRLERSLALGAALTLVLWGGSALGEDSGLQKELSGEGDKQVLVDLRGVKRATAIYRICIAKDTAGSPLIIGLVQQRNLSAKPRTLFKRNLSKGDGNACIDLGVREDRYIEVSTLKNGTGNVTLTYRLMAAF